MKQFQSFIDKIKSIPTIEIREDLQHFFSIFLHQSILFSLLTPFALSVPAFLFIFSFSTLFSFIGIAMFLLAFIIFIIWVYLSLLFFFAVTVPKTWPRYVAISWFFILLLTFTFWLFLFN